MHTDRLSRLAEILTAQHALCQQLIACADKQREAIRERRPPVIEETAREQEQLFTELTQWEEERLDLLGADGPSLNAIIEQAPAPWRERLTALGRQVRAALEAFMEKNRINQRLLEQELALIGLYLSVLSPGDGGEVYNHPRSRRRQSSAGPLAFDARV